MQKHYSLAIADIADEVQVATNTLRRRFQEDLGLSPKQVQDNMRIEHACELLGQQTYPWKKSLRCAVSPVTRPLVYVLNATVAAHRWSIVRIYKSRLSLSGKNS